MKNQVSLQWLGKMQFSADNPGGNFKIDAPEDGDTSDGLRPKALMLASLAGCSGLDIVSLLKKMRAEVDNLEINVTGELTDEHPKYYHKVHMEYKFYGKDFKKDKIEKAITLSIDKYCGVMAMFKKFAEVTTSSVYITQ